MSHGNDCLHVYLQGGPVLPSLHHHVHQGVSQAALSGAGRHQEVHSGHAAARELHSTKRLLISHKFPHRLVWVRLRFWMCAISRFKLVSEV